MMLTGPIGTYSYQQKLTVQTGGDKTLRGPAVRQNLIAVITEACITNYTRDDRMLLIGKTDSGDIDHVVKMLPEDTGHSLELNGKMILLEDEKPYAQVFNANIGSVFYVTFHGLIYRRDSKPEPEK